MNKDKKTFIQVWKELSYFLIWFVIGGFIISSLRDDKPWFTFVVMFIVFGVIELLYLTGYWVFVGFKNNKDANGS
jgi:ABC-type polysaccharide transport system permease subunit